MPRCQNTLESKACQKIRQVLSLKKQVHTLANYDIFRIFIFSFLVISSSFGLGSPLICSDVLSQDFQRSSLAKSEGNSEERQKQTKTSGKITAQELSVEAAHKMLAVPEFQFIRKEAERLGLRVWLFGGTASSYLHYVKWNLAREKGINQLQADRFDFDYTNIFRSTQDLDVVVDGTVEQAREFQKTIAAKYPHFLGAKAAKWEVRTLRTRMGNPGEFGYKEALLGDEDFNHQNSDSNSLGMVEVTHSKEPVVRDLRHWDSVDSPFLQDALNDRISFFRSREHFTTSRAKAGENPEILSVVRLLVKAFQYELKFSENEFNEMKAIVDQFDPKQLQNAAAKRRLEDTAKKLVMHATNIEYAMDQLDRLGLRKKLIQMGKKDDRDSMSWWLNKEPLRSKLVGQGTGKTAEELGIKVVAHDTNNFFAYESITRSHSGEPNVVVSRQNGVKGETAAHGDGFYTRIGREGAKNTGLTTRFTVDPKAREGTDFTLVNGDYVVFKNKKALIVIQESLNLGLDDILKFVENNPEIQADSHYSDLALLEKLKRKLNAAKITEELDNLFNSPLESDQEKLIHILSAFRNSYIEKLFSNDVLNSVAKNVYHRVSEHAQSSNETNILRYIKTVGPILRRIDSLEIIKSAQFHDYLYRLIQSPKASSNLKRQAVFELLLTNENFDEHLNFRRDLQPDELRELTSEIKEWENTTNFRKRKFLIELNKKCSEAIAKGDIEKLRAYVDSGIIDINHKNISQVSILQLASYYKQKRVIDWLIANPEFDFNVKNDFGFTEVEQLRLSGKEGFANLIENQRPESRARRLIVNERNVNERTNDYPNGTPIVDFVRFEPGSFMMGERVKVLTTLTRPFEIMSVDITQETYKIIVELLHQKLSPGDYNGLSPNPSHKSDTDADITINLFGFFNNFIGRNKSASEKQPVDQVSYDDVALWKKGLNELSKLDDPQVQQTLEKLFPGHKLNKVYDIPTAAEWEYVSRLGGLAEGDFSHGTGDAGLGDYTVNADNSGSGKRPSWPVGSKKPVFYNGKPIFDLHGNVWRWVKDWYSEDWYRIPNGGVDPQGPTMGNSRVKVGGGRNSAGNALHSYYRSEEGPSARNDNLGFRLVRSVE